MQALQGQMHGEMFYMQLVGEMREEDFTTLSVESSQTVNETDIRADVQMSSSMAEVESKHSEPGDTSRTSSLARGLDTDSQRWTLHFNDLPEVAGRRPVTSRMISSIDLAEGNAMQFMDKWGYSYISEYILEGHRVTYHNVMLLLHRILRCPSDPERPSRPHDRLYGLQDYIPIDLSGAFVLQASVRLQDGNKPESISLGLNELKSIKEMVKGVVELEPGDRLALDTRVKNG
ncbi:MAG: Mediator of RNA polymerase II transcription subunit 18 [Candelina submexicana]|nr:MAG: Mediator of RNA polymerase II transcription subunit 18 [Candelina submexicana]